VLDPDDCEFQDYYLERKKCTSSILLSKGSPTTAWELKDVVCCPPRLETGLGIKVGVLAEGTPLYFLGDDAKISFFVLDSKRKELNIAMIDKK
jgi:hypothetical protein